MSVNFYSRKGRRCKSAPEPESSSSDSDDDERKHKISHKMYLSAELDHALHRRLDYVRAVQELTAIIKMVYSYLPKATQAQVVADACTAIYSCDGSKFHSQALLSLLGAIEQHFPKSKRAACLREAKKAGLLRAREEKKSAAQSNISASGCQFLPDEMLQLIFASLEPVDLSRAACVCSAWGKLTSSNSLWQKFLPEPCLARVASESYKALFLRELICPSWLEGIRPLWNIWHSRRELSNAHLSWRSGPVNAELLNRSVSCRRDDNSPEDVVICMAFMTSVHRRKQRANWMPD